MSVNYRQIKAIEQQNKKRWLSVNETLNEGPGIYFLTRVDEDGFKYAYIGQAKHILTRLAQHLSGYQHIDLSLKKHGLYKTDNQYGWKVGFLTFPEDLLDVKEQKYIKDYALGGYQLLNKTSGSQGEGKKQIAEYRPNKTYRDGLLQGYKNAQRDIKHLFDLHLDVKTKKENPTVNQQKALKKFLEFIE